MKEPSSALPGIKRSACFLATAFIWTLLPLATATATAASHPDDNYASSYLRSTPRSGFGDTLHTDRLLQDASTETTCTETCCEQFQKTCPSTNSNPLSSVPLSIQIVLIILLISFSALFSGLTLGLMSLDKTGLEIVIGGDDEKYREMAKKIYPIRKNGNLLLCTLLLGNVSVNALLSILLADKAGGIIGFLSSTFIIVIFGEIIPQASCSRYALEIGSRTIPLVRVIILLFYPVAFPLAWILDRALGQELATTYSNAEMLKLLQIHVQEEMLDKDTANAMTGALKYRDMAVQDVMTPLANAFMLSVEEKLNFETIAAIFKTGYSRIPVYEINKNNVIGLLFVKDLIFIDPEDDTRVADFVDIFGRGVHVVWPDDKLGDVLRELKRGRSHMAVVRDVNNEDDRDPFYEIKGIITLEDIIEEIIGDEIVDETDAFVDGTHKEKVDRGETFKWARLRLLDSKIVDETLSFDETRAVTAHLLKNYPDVVALLTENQLQRLIAENHVQLLPTATHELGQPLPSDLLYEKGLPTDMCTLLLAGKVTVLAGIENFRSDVSSWCLLAPGALSNNSYSPDFTAYVSSGPVRCLRISRLRFDAAVDASAIEKNTGISTPQTSSRKLVEEPAEVVSDLTHPSEHAAQPSPEHDARDSDNRKGRLLSALQMVGGKKRLSGRFVAPHGDGSALASDAGSSSSRQDTSMNRDELARSLRGSSSSRVIEYIGSPASKVTPDSEKGDNQ